MRRDKSLHEISASARIAALLEKQGRGREGVFFLSGCGGTDKQGGWEKTRLGDLTATPWREAWSGELEDSFVGSCYLSIRLDK